jgi:hypothetical protein
MLSKTRCIARVPLRAERSSSLLLLFHELLL